LEPNNPAADEVITVEEEHALSYIVASQIEYQKTASRSAEKTTNIWKEIDSVTRGGINSQISTKGRSEQHESAREKARTDPDQF